MSDPIGEGWIPPATTAERLERGRRLREHVPRRSLSALRVDGRDPLAILDEQNASRLQEFVPLRKERMSQSVFAFYRGGAALMAADLGASAHSGILLPSCGDAHISNFGFFASPQRTLVFDLNDFDEAAWAPWEWDLKRLVASLVLAGAETLRDEETTRLACMRAVLSYALSLRRAVELTPIDRYFSRLDAEAGLRLAGPSSRKAVKRAIKQAERKTGARAVGRLTAAGENGRLRFLEQPPTMVPVADEVARAVRRHVVSYLETASSDVQQLLGNYVVSDVIRRVVGVGSVGTRCALVLLQDGDGGALLMQSKEANRSVLEQYGGIEQPADLVERIREYGEGARVVALQHVLQAVSDPLLGYLRADGIELYVRQFHDMKGGIEATELDDDAFITYAEACAVTLARAHSQVPEAAVVSGYIGKGGVIAEVVTDWAYAYADLVRQDFAAFTR